MTSKEFFGCYEIPGYGGANTASYQLFHLMQQDGCDVPVESHRRAGRRLLQFVWPQLRQPRSLTHAYNCLCKVLWPHPGGRAREMAPDVIVAVDFIAALLMKRAAPKTR
jgi:hypothetical protein